MNANEDTGTDLVTNDGAPEVLPVGDAADADDAGDGEAKGGTKKKNGIRDLAVGRSNLLFFKASDLHPRGDNLRIWETEANKAKVREFADTIYDGGVRNAITVASDNGRIVIEDGETRWRAIRLLEGFDVLTGETVPARVEPDTIKIPAVIDDKKGNDVTRLTNLMVRNSGRDFSDLEIANGIARLISWNVLQREIADKLGKTQTWVSMMYKLTQAPHSIQLMLRDEKVTATTVVNAFREFGGDRSGDDTAVWARVEQNIHNAVEHARSEAAVEFGAAVAEAEEANAEVTRLMDSPEGQEPVNEAEGRPGRKSPTKLEAAQRRAAAAGERVDKARKAKDHGPERVTGRNISQAEARRNPEAAKPPRMTKTVYEALLDGVKFEAGRSIDPKTRERMNLVLKRCGFPLVEARVEEDEGEATDAVAEADAGAAEPQETSVAA